MVSLHPADAARGASDDASEPIEAARIDGANAWQVFRHVVLPLLRPAMVVTILFRLIESVKAFL